MNALDPEPGNFPSMTAEAARINHDEAAELLLKFCGSTVCRAPRSGLR